VAVTSRGVAVAHDGVVDLYKFKSLERVWRVDGVAYPGAMAADDHRVVVLNPIANVARVVDLATGTTTSFATGETPVAAAFIEKQLYVLARDARAVERIAMDGTKTSVKIGAAAQSFVPVGDKIYVYSSIDGLFQEITTSPFAVARQVRIAPFASSFDTEGANGYFTYPNKRLLLIVDIKKMEVLGDTKIGSSPIDVHFAGDATLFSPRMLGIADPSDHRVWLIAVQQGTIEAFARGFLRGLSGFAPNGAVSTAFPTGIDRVISNGMHWLAFDSLTGTLYELKKKTTVELGRDLPPRAFALALAGSDLYLWRDGTLVAKTL
jgi:hypothetical protein